MTFYKKRSLFSAENQSTFLTNKVKNYSLIIILLSSLLSAPSIAEEVAEDEQNQYLISSCNAFKNKTGKAKTLPCTIYIRGFFSGVINAGTTDTLKVEKGNKESSTFVERAYANRVGKRGERESIDYNCLTVNELKLRILENLSDDSLNPLHSVKQLNTLLVNTLLTACSAE